MHRINFVQALFWCSRLNESRVESIIYWYKCHYKKIQVNIKFRMVSKFKHPI